MFHCLQGSSEALQAASLLLPKDEARLLRRDLQQPAACLQQSPSSLQCSSLKPAPDRQSHVRPSAKHGQQPQSLGNVVDQHSTATASDGFRRDSNHACDQCTSDTVQNCSVQSQHASLDLPQSAAERPLSDSAQAQAQDSQGANPNTSESGPSQGQKRSSSAAASTCSEFHADSLKFLQRRIVAKKRKRSRDGAAQVATTLEDSDSAASCSEVATMTFIEPHSNKAATSVDGPQAKKQHQHNSRSLAIGQQ